MSFKPIQLPEVIIQKRGLSDLFAELLSKAMSMTPKDVKKILEI